MAMVHNGFLTRRDFLRQSGVSAFGFAVIMQSSGLLTGCGTMPVDVVKDLKSVHYPRLSGQKIQSPDHYGQHGCMVGYYYGQKLVGRPIKIFPEVIERYIRIIGKPPSVIYQPNPFYRNQPNVEFAKDQAITAAEHGVIPSLILDVRMLYEARRSHLLEDIIRGKADARLRRYAKESVKFGKQYGGFFFRTLIEANGGTYPWRGQPEKVKEAWRHMWELFEVEGANEYVTWVWDQFYQGWYISNSNIVKWSSWPDDYYPGNRYVDWIGMNVWNFGDSQSYSHWESIDEALGFGYSNVRKNHPDKPVMLAEFGCHEQAGKAKWVKDTFKQVKEKYKGIKLIGWIDFPWYMPEKNSPTKNIVNSSIDSSEASLRAFVKGVADPYYLGKVPYRTF